LEEEKKMNKRNLAVMASCMLLYTSFAYAANAEETQNSDSVAAEKNSQSETQLDEVVVTDTMLNPLKIPVKMTVITEEQIKAKGAQTVAEALKDVAGLNVTQLAKGKGAGQIRGSDSNSTKVIVDGVMISGGGDSRADLSVIPTDNIEKIEIFKGPVPVIYGSNAPGGVIFITTKNASGKAAGALTMARGSWDSEIYSLSVSGKADQLSYYLSGKKSKTGGYDDNPDNIGGYKSHTAEKAEYFNGKLKWDIDPKSSLTVFGSYTETKKELPNRYGVNPFNHNVQLMPYPGSGGTLTARNNYFGGGNAYNVSGLTYNWEYQPIRESYIGTVYNRKLNDRNDVSLKYYRSTLSSLLTTVNVSNNLPAYQYIDWDGSVNGWELTHTMKTSKANVLTWGYSWETRDFVELTPNQNSTVINRGDYDYTGRSFYIQDVANINSRLSTSFGYRHNSVDDGIVVDTIAYTPYHQDLRGKYTSDDPVFTLAYKLSDNTAIHGSIGTSFRSPTAMERSAPLNNITVLPEEGINREIGLTATAKSGLFFDFTYFSRDITNMIKGGGAGGGHSQYWNIPDVDMHGYELEVSKKINKRLKGFWNYSYTNAYDTTVHTQVSDVPYRKHSWGLNYTDKGLVANLAVNYVGGRRSMFSQGNGNGNSDGNSSVNQVYTFWGTQNLAGYHVVDLKVSKTIDNQEYYMKVLNLFDKDYYTGAYFVAPGRYVEVGTTIKF